MKIDRCMFADLEATDGWGELIDEYAREAGNPLMPPVRYDPVKYRQFCQVGLLRSFSAKIETDLIGFLLVIVTPLPKYSVPVATVDSCFVRKTSRMSGAGFRLFAKAEEVARDEKCVGVFASSPLDGALGNALPRMGYTECNRIYFKPASYA